MPTKTMWVFAWMSCGIFCNPRSLRSASSNLCLVFPSFGGPRYVICPPRSLADRRCFKVVWPRCCLMALFMVGKWLLLLIQIQLFAQSTCMVKAAVYFWVTFKTSLWVRGLVESQPQLSAYAVRCVAVWAWTAVIHPVEIAIIMSTLRGSPSGQPREIVFGTLT